jgi:hypothetical protein
MRCSTSRIHAVVAVLDPESENVISRLLTFSATCSRQKSRHIPVPGEHLKLSDEDWILRFLIALTAGFSTRVERSFLRRVTSA